METPALPVIVIGAALLLSYYFGVRGLEDVTDHPDYAKGIYGTAIATMGMLRRPPTSWRWIPLGLSRTTPAALSK